MQTQQPLWRPSQESIAAANLTAFIAEVNRTHGLDIDGYDALYRWSIDEKEKFWSQLWDFCGIVGDKGERILIDGDDIENAQWFPDASLNFAENLLRKKDDATAIHFRAEDQVEYSLTWKQLHAQVASLADHHFRISKVTDGKSTRTQVHTLGKDERIEELARMLGGVEITAKTLEHAAEMLAGAARKRA